jgi:hypothetical protein
MDLSEEHGFYFVSPGISFLLLSVFSVNLLPQCCEVNVVVVVSVAGSENFEVFFGTISFVRVLS